MCAPRAASAPTTRSSGGPPAARSRGGAARVYYTALRIPLYTTRQQTHKPASTQTVQHPKVSEYRHHDNNTNYMTTQSATPDVVAALRGSSVKFVTIQRIL